MAILSATLPPEWYRENRIYTLENMPKNSVFYVVPWAFVRRDKDLCVNGTDFQVYFQPSGTACLGVLKEDDGSFSFDFSHLEGRWDGWSNLY